MGFQKVRTVRILFLVLQRIGWTRLGIVVMKKGHEKVVESNDISEGQNTTYLV